MLDIYINSKTIDYIISFEISCSNDGCPRITAVWFDHLSGDSIYLNSLQRFSVWIRIVKVFKLWCIIAFSKRKNSEVKLMINMIRNRLDSCWLLYWSLSPWLLIIFNNPIYFRLRCVVTSLGGGINAMLHRNDDSKFVSCVASCVCVVRPIPNEITSISHYFFLFKIAGQLIFFWTVTTFWTIK